MSSTVTGCGSRSTERDLSPLIGQANDVVFAQNAMGMFATLFYGVLIWTATGPSMWSAAQRGAPHHRRRPVLGMKGSGPPLGFFPEPGLARHALQLAPGDGLFLFTDGVTERLDPANAEYGDERFRRCFVTRSARARKPWKPCRRRRRVRGQRRENDDITCVSVVLAWSPRSVLRDEWAEQGSNLRPWD